MTEWEKDREKEEFSRAAILYRPLSSAIASRFIRATEDHLSTENEPRCDSKVAECKKSKEDCDRRKAASLGMFGRLTRITYEWHPTKLLCKRFNIPNPFPGSRVLGVPGRSKQKTNTSFPGVVPDPYLEDEKKSDMSTETFESMKSLEREDKDSSSEEENENIIRLPVNRNVKGKITIGPLSHLNKLLGKDAENDRNKDNNVEKEGVLNEPQKPSMDLFKAIFEDSDDESENEDDKEALGNNQKEALKIGVKDDSVLMTETCNNSDRALDITEIVYLTSDVMSDRKEPSADLSDLEVKNSVSLSRNKHGPLPESKTTKLRTTEQGKAPFQFIEKSRVNHAQSKYKAEHVTESVSKTTENIHRTNHTYGPSLPVQQPSADLMRNALSSNERLTSGLSERHNVTKFDLSRDKSHEISHHHHPKSKKEKKKKTKSKHKHKQKQKDSHKKKRKKQKTEKHSKNYSSDTDSTDSDEYDSSSMKKLKTLRKESSSDSDTNNDTIVPSSKLLLEKLKKYGKGIRRPSAADFM